MKQLSLDSARTPEGHGGWRPGAGRKKQQGSVSHRTRAPFPTRFPQHVTLRLGADTPRIASEWLMKRVIRPCIALCEKPFFRVVEFNVLSNHVHLICEADDAMTLARGVQGLAIRLARRLNTALKRKGKLFGPRYHAVALRRSAIPCVTCCSIESITRPRRSGSLPDGSIRFRAARGFAAGTRRSA